MNRPPQRLDPSINAYFNALLRETGPWLWLRRQRHFAISHPASGETLLVPCHFRSLGGRHLLGPQLLLDEGAGPRPISFRAAVEWTLLLPELRDQSSRLARESFRHRVVSSDRNLRLALAYIGQQRPRPDNRPLSFIESEQALVNGHSIHPCPKDRGNMSQQEATDFAPEYRRQFPLVWYSIDSAYLRCHESARASLDGAARSLLEQEAPAVRQAVESVRADGHVTIPCHPFQHRHWQAHPELGELQARGHLRRLGTGTAPWHATSSLRAIWSGAQDWMLKFSLSVRITNSLRHLQPREAVRGPALTDLLDTAPARAWLSRHPAFRVMNEPVAAAICNRQGQPVPETTLVFRDNPFTGEAAEGCELLATLLQDDPSTGLSRLGTGLRARNAGRAGAKAWLRSFLELAVSPLLDAQSNLGLLFGAHQQNLILRLNREFQPVAAWFRDCQGTGFSALAHRQFGPGLAAAIQQSENELPDALGVRLFCYYLFVNSTFNVIASLAAADLCPEADLWHQLRIWLRQRRSANPADPSAIDYLLGSPHLYAKNNFMCSLRALNENTLEDLESIYHPMPNPLVVGQPTETKDRNAHDSTLLAH